MKMAEKLIDFDKFDIRSTVVWEISILIELRSTLLDRHE